MRRARNSGELVRNVSRLFPLRLQPDLDQAADGFCAPAHLSTFAPSAGADHTGSVTASGLPLTQGG